MQRKRTFSFSLCSPKFRQLPRFHGPAPTARGFSKKIAAQFRLSAATILREKANERSDAVQINCVNQRSPGASGSHETGPAQVGEMEGHGRSRHAQLVRDVARGHPVGPFANQEAEYGKAGFLRQAGEGVDGPFYFHISKYIEMIERSQRMAVTAGLRSMNSNGTGFKVDPCDRNSLPRKGSMLCADFGA